MLYRESNKDHCLKGVFFNLWCGGTSPSTVLSLFLWVFLSRQGRFSRHCRSCGFIISIQPHGRAFSLFETARRTLHSALPVFGQTSS